MTECVLSALVRKANKTDEDKTPFKQISRHPLLPSNPFLQRSLSTHEFPVSLAAGQTTVQ